MERLKRVVIDGENVTVDGIYMPRRIAEEYIQRFEHDQAIYFETNKTRHEKNLALFTGFYKGQYYRKIR